jgi:hypothetical protein
VHCFPRSPGRECIRFFSVVVVVVVLVAMLSEGVGKYLAVSTEGSVDSDLCDGGASF